MPTSSICFVGLENLPALAAEFSHLAMGGAQLQQTLLAKALVKRGFAVSMVVGDHGQADGRQWAGIRTLRAYRPMAGLPIVRFVHPRWTSVWAAMRRADAEVYYVSTAGMLLGEVALFARRHRRKVVFRIAHDSDCEPDQLLIPNFRDKWLYRYGLRHADLVLAQSEKQRASMAANFQRSAEVIPSLLEANDVVAEFADRDIDAIWISNIRPFKRPDLALEFARRHPHLTLHMVGGTQPGQEAYFESIKASAAELRNVAFHGPLPYADVNALIARAKVLINTSDAEGFPNTFLQSWARGTPVLTFFDPDGIVERDSLGRTVKSVEQLCAAAAEFVRGDDAWLRTSRHCVEFVNRRHGEGAADRYAQAIRAA